MSPQRADEAVNHPHETAVAAFVPGLELCRRFYVEAVRPALEARFPGLAHTAALIGPGSETLGFDAERSTDHHWGPRVLLFVSPADFSRRAAPIVRALSEALPVRFMGYPTNFGPPDAVGVRLLRPVARGPVAHRVEVLTISGFCRDYLGCDPARSLTMVDWLLMPEQRLLSVTAGAVYHDGLGELEELRERLRYYPRDLWLYLLAAQWDRIGQEEAFVGRCAEAGDELGSQLVAARLVRDLMRLCFLLERCYAPYSKWLGSAFAQLDCAAQLRPLLERALAANDFAAREAALSSAYEDVAARHNALGLGEPLTERVSPFWGRPYLVIHADVFAAATRALIQDPAVRALPIGVGAIDQFIDNVGVLSRPTLGRRLAGLFTAAERLTAEACRRRAVCGQNRRPSMPQVVPAAVARITTSLRNIIRFCPCSPWSFRPASSR